MDIFQCSPFVKFWAGGRERQHFGTHWAILINNNNNGNGTNILKLNREHKPNLPDEKRRILFSGGRVDCIYGIGPYLVWFKDGDYPLLPMNRSIGIL